MGPGGRNRSAGARADDGRAARGIFEAKGRPPETLPFAMTSPLWIDADSDERSLGRAAAP
ncbi:hypothetical protein WME94_44720 [Sorangium sp. So ce429]